MTPTKESAETGSSSAETEVSRTKGRPRPESAHLRADAVSLEIPVKVHGSLVPTAALGAPAQAQPFEEQTSTIIVFPQGGVLKMSTAINAGQVMVLTNLKSRQDSICRVVKVRAYGKGLSYVEVEFTSPQAGYWGVYFPSDGPEVARMVPQQPQAGSAVPTQPAPAQVPAGTPARPTPAATHVEQKAPNVSWAPAVAPPSASKAPEPGLRAEAPQSAVAPPKPPAPPKLPESSFASIGTKEEVLAPADATRTPRLTAFPAGATKAHPGADSDISDAIDALMAPAIRSSPSAPALNQTSYSERSHGIAEKEKEADAPAAAQAKSSVSHWQNAGSEASLPVPKQMFGVMLDSASPISAQSAGTTGKMWLPMGIVALLAVGAAGAYYFHFRPASNAAAASTPTASAPSVSVAQPTISQQSTPASIQSNAGHAQEAPDQFPAALPSPSTAPSNDASLDSVPSSTEREPDSSAKSRGVESFTPHRAAPQVLADKQTIIAAPSQPKSAVPSTFAVRNGRPLVRFRASANSIGTAPALEDNGAPAEPISSLPTLAAPAPNVPVPPKSVSTTPIRVGGKILPPRLVSSVLPVYPSIAQQANVTGTVVIDTTIDKNGNVAKTRVISGPELLRQAALGALRQWKYEPSRLNGQPISVEMIVSIQFH